MVIPSFTSIQYLKTKKQEITGESKLYKHSINKKLKNNFGECKLSILFKKKPRQLL